MDIKFIRSQVAWFDQARCLTWSCCGSDRVCGNAPSQFQGDPKSASSRCNDCKLWVGRPLLCLTCPKIDVFPQKDSLTFKAILYFFANKHIFKHIVFDLFRKMIGILNLGTLQWHCPVFEVFQRTTAKATAWTCHQRRHFEVRLVCGRNPWIVTLVQPLSAPHQKTVAAVRRACTQIFWGCGWCCNLSYPHSNQALQLNWTSPTNGGFN